MDLSLVTLDELLDEIRTRCDCGVIILHADRSEDEGGLSVNFWGNPFTELGLLDYARGEIKRDIQHGLFEKDEL